MGGGEKPLPTNSQCRETDLETECAGGGEQADGDRGRGGKGLERAHVSDVLRFLLSITVG